MKKHIGILLLLLFVVAALTVSGCKAPPDTEPPEDQETPGGDLPGEPNEGDDPMQSKEKLNVYKSASHRTAETVSPGETLTYTVTVKNSGTKAASVEIKDTLPAKTAYVSGNGTVSGQSVTLTANVPAGGEAALTYTVRVNADASGTIVAPKATAGELQSESLLNYVGLTFNAIDRAYMAKGIAVISYSEEIDSISLAKMMYTVAFTKVPELSGTPADVLKLIFEATATETGDAYRKMVVPTLFGARAADTVKSSRFRGESAWVEKEDLIAGDLLFVQNGDAAHLYIYDGAVLICLDNGYGKVDTATILSGLRTAEQYAVLRPSLSFTSAFAPYEGDAAVAVTDLEKALLATAEAYFYRGYRAQYADTRMPSTYLSSSDRGEFRWQIGKRQPEDYTSANWGYINCAAFTYEVYRNALGYDLGSLYTTANLAKYYTDGGKVGVSMYPYFYRTNTKATAAEIQQVRENFFATLKFGDLVVVRRNNGGGHVMMYIGNKTVIHSGGGNFNYSEDREVYEATVRYMNLDWYLFDEASANYIFQSNGYIQHLSIVRPLDKCSSVPDNTKNRMENLGGIFSEKVSSIGTGASISAGGEVTFTFHIQNFGNVTKTLAVTDIVPANTTLKAAPGATVSGNHLAWSVTVEPGAVAEVSYTVIAGSAAVIESKDGKVGGVAHRCPDITVKRTLTAAEQDAFKEAAEALQKSNPKGLTGLALVNEIYRRAGLDAPFVNSGKDLSISTLRSSLFQQEQNKIWKLNPNSPYYKLVAPTLYGGRKYFTPQQYTATSKANSDRTRLPRVQDMVVGDVLVVKFLSSEAMYLYVGGDHFLNLGKATLDEDTYTSSVRLMRMMSAGQYFAVIRPSFGWK